MAKDVTDPFDGWHETEDMIDGIRTLDASFYSEFGAPHDYFALSGTKTALADIATILTSRPNMRVHHPTLFSI